MTFVAGNLKKNTAFHKEKGRASSKTAETLRAGFGWECDHINRSELGLYANPAACGSLQLYSNTGE